MNSNGFINFPALTGTEKMYVVLVVVPKGDAWALCSIRYPVIPAGEIAGYSDLTRPVIDWSTANTDAGFARAVNLSAGYVYRFFPNIRAGDDMSQNFLAVIHMGTADYAPGYDDPDWAATYDDLTVEGRTIWHFLKVLYQDKGELVLITFVDT